MHQHCPLIVTFSGLFLLIAGLIYTLYALPLVEDHLIKKIIALKEGTVGYKFWKKTDLKFRVYFFEILNSDSVQTGEKPNLRERGPYVYDEYRVKEILAINETTDTIKYISRKSYVFNENESGGRRENDVITTINAGLLGIVSKLKKVFPKFSHLNLELPFLFPGISDIFIRGTVKEILFEGLELTCKNNNTAILCQFLSKSTPTLMRFADNNEIDYLVSMFSHLKSEEISYEIKRGIKNSLERGEIVAYQNKSLLQTWRNVNCNKINGTDFTLFPSIPFTSDKIYFFKSDICRSVPLYFERKNYELNGLNSITFSSKAETLDANNQCYCSSTKRKQQRRHWHCPPNGLLDLTPCFNFPLLLSYPHFYLGDPLLLDFAVGTQPQKLLHESFATIEAKTGAPLIAKQRWQLNVNLSKFDEIELLANVSEGIFPLLWIEEELQQSPEFIEVIASTLGHLKVLNILKYCIIVSGIAVMCLSVLLLLYREKLMCFSNLKNRSVSARIAKKLLTTEHFNSPQHYPNLYPQMENKNFSGRLVKRNGQNGRKIP